MPVYEYACSKGHRYEKTEGFDAPSRQKCITCGALARRQISLPAVIFKGSGFYSTDNRKSSRRNGSPSGSESGSESSSESSPQETASTSDSHDDAKPAKPAKATKVEAASAD